jgi:hypothetical protein
MLLLLVRIVLVESEFFESSAALFVLSHHASCKPSHVEWVGSTDSDKMFDRNSAA